MAHITGLFLYAVAGVGILVLLIQLVAVRGHVAAPGPPAAHDAPGISILKPLCGLDDELAANLAAFATLPYPRAELLLGVADRSDTAYPIAAAAAARWPDRVRVVVQSGAPGKNPKVNQLVTLAAAARHPVLVVSDANVRPPAGYLDGIAGALADPGVGLVTHAIVGGGERSLGARLDGAHLSALVGPGVIAAKRVAGKDIVVGKSMAFRASDLAALGGFAAVKDVLAEDYVLGLLVPGRLGKRVVVAREPITQVTCRRSTADFVRRAFRWAVIHKKAVSPLTFAGELVLNPISLAAVGFLLAPSPAAAAFVAAKIAVDAANARALCGRPLCARALLAVPLKDLLLGAVWARALFSDTVVWRGRRLRVGAGTVLRDEMSHDRHGSEVGSANAAGRPRRRAVASAS
jgi:ceramide glucosyltransferase